MSLIDFHAIKKQTQTLLTDINEAILEMEIVDSSAKSSKKGGGHARAANSTPVRDSVQKRFIERLTHLIEWASEVRQSLEADNGAAPVSTSATTEKTTAGVATETTEETSAEVATETIDTQDSLKAATTTPNPPLAWTSDARLQFPCDANKLGKNMVSTIADCLATLDAPLQNHGYMILKVGTLPQVNWEQVSRGATKPNQDEIITSKVENPREGVARLCLTDERPSFVCPDFSVSKPDPSLYPEHGFQQFVDQPPQHNLVYYIGVPFDYPVPGTDLVHPGDKLSRRGDIPLPGINTPYWYISTCYGTWANLHIEDAKTGSVNLLLAGAPKDWLFIHQSSTYLLETCLRKEFPNLVKPCSQFVRHLNLILSPHWLRTREIAFSTVRQYPGQMICTLVGIYYQVVNCGENFAVAINFELDEWDDPMDYVWCRKGVRSCGSAVLTKNEFRLRASSRPQKNIEIPINLLKDKPSQRQYTRDEQTSERPNKPVHTIAIDDDDPSQASRDEATDWRMTTLPPPQVEPELDVEVMIRFCLSQNLSPSLLGCSSVKEMEEILRQFLPGHWLGSTALRLLLQVICSSVDGYVFESLGLEISDPQLKASIEFQDTPLLVFPFFVNPTTQSSRHEKNHWVLGVFDVHSMLFTSFGIDEKLAMLWVSALENRIKEASGKEYTIQHAVGEVPLNDGGSCALVCCLALEKYLGSHPPDMDPPYLRAFYLRKLLDAFMFSSQHSDLINEPLTGLVLCGSSTPLDDVCVEMTDPDVTQEALISDLDSVPNEQFVNNALLDESSKLSLEQRARILQMIMQCSSRVLTALDRCLKAENDSLRTMSGDFRKDMQSLLDAIDQNTDKLYLIVIKQRMIMMQLAKRFDKEVGEETRMMQQIRKERRRQQNNGVKLDPLPNSGIKPRNRVLDRLNPASKKNTSSKSKMSRARLTTYINLGRNLSCLSAALNPMVVYTFPVYTVQPCDLCLTFPSVGNLLATKIEPSMYDELQGDRALYFIKWFPKIRRELRQLASVDYRFFLPGATLPENPATQLKEVHTLVATITQRCHQERKGMPL